MYITINLDNLPFTFLDERIKSDMSAQIESIGDDYAINGKWFVDTHDGYLTIRGSLAKPTSLTLEVGYFPMGVQSLLFD